jgi:hypothetical protein
LPNSGAASGENDGADEIDVLDTLLGPVIREPQPIRLAFGGATGPAVAPAGRWLVPNPMARPPSGQLALVPAAPAAANSTALPGQIAPATSGPAVQLTPPTATANPGAILGTVGQAVPIPVPSPLPRPN